VTTLVGAATAGLDVQGTGTWALADAIARIRDADPAQLGLVLDIVEALARRTGRPAAEAWRRGRR
jgi:hypothetical protein